MKKNALLRLAALFTIMLFSISVLAACGGSTVGGPDDRTTVQDGDTTAPEQTAGETAGELKYKGKITMYAQGYHPVEPTQTNPNPPTKIKEIAQKYAELHPDIEIEFIPSLEGQDYNAWLKTKISGGMAPDIFWAQWMDLNGQTFPMGCAVDMNQYLDKPNPYVPDNEKWSDLFYPNIQKQIADVNGEHWNIDGDYVATAVVYNKELFAKAGIDKDPANWTEFIEAGKKLLDAGITPLAFPFGNNSDSQDRMTWISRLFFTNFYSADFEELAVEGSTASLNAVETLAAFKNGVFGPKDPRWLGWWETVKNLAPYLQKDFTSAATSPDTVFNMFLNKQVAMYFDGSWAGRNLKNANVDFEIGTFPFPPPDKGSSEFATDFNSSGAIGGPNAAFQYCISSPKANKNMSDDKRDACADWLMFITTPENNAAIVNELGSFVPLVKGAKPLPENENLVSLFDEQPLTIDGGLGSLGSELLDAYYRTFQQYLTGKITIEDAARTLQPIVDKVVDGKIKDAGIDIDQYIK